MRYIRAGHCELKKRWPGERGSETSHGLLLESCLCSCNSAFNREEHEHGEFCLGAPVLSESLSCRLLMLHYPIPPSPWSDRCSPFLSIPIFFHSFITPSPRILHRFISTIGRWIAIKICRASLFSPQTFFTDFMCGWVAYLSSDSANKCKIFPFSSRPPHTNTARICTQTFVSSFPCRRLMSDNQWWSLFLRIILR